MQVAGLLHGIKQLARTIPIELSDQGTVQATGWAIEHNLTVAQGHDPLEVAPCQFNLVKADDGGDALALVELQEVVHHTFG